MPLPAKVHDFHPAASIFDAGETPTTTLFTGLLDELCRDDEPMQRAVPIACLKQLIAARAWTDAALALVALEAPHWKLRSLRYDGGEWHCALSRQREMPEWLDQSAEAHHPHMAMAILSAFQEIDADPSRLGSVPAIPSAAASFEPMLCENFA